MPIPLQREQAGFLFLLLMGCGDDLPDLPEFDASCSPEMFELPERACDQPDDCLEIEACSNGWCGSCQTDPDCGDGRVCREGFCFPDALPIFALGIDSTDLDQILAHPHHEIFVPCTLTASSTSYDEGCKVRLRGGSSRDYPKKSFRITFPNGAEHPGYSRKINLRAEYNDRSFMRHFLASEVFRRLTHLPTSRARFVRLELNGSYYGLMMEVERMGGDFLEQNGRSREESMYEADPDLELHAQGGCSLIPLGSEDLYRRAYDKKSGNKGLWGDLRSLIEEVIWSDFADTDQRIPTRTARLRSAFDLQGALTYLAAIALVQNHDHVRKNYYLSLQPDGDDMQWEIYPWDLDLSFGCLYDDLAQNTICDDFITNGSEARGVIPDGVAVGFPMEGHYNLLIHLLLNDPDLYPGFRCRVCTMLDSPFWQRDLARLVDALKATLQDAVAEDERDLNESVQGFEQAAREIHRFISERSVILRKRLRCE